jgi:hypothetical protein
MPQAEAEARLARAAAIFARAAVRAATRARRTQLASVSAGAACTAAGDNDFLAWREPDVPGMVSSCVSEGVA